MTSDSGFKFVVPGLVPGIHVLWQRQQARRGWPGQARPWRRRRTLAALMVRASPVPDCAFSDDIVVLGSLPAGPPASCL